MELIPYDTTVEAAKKQNEVYRKLTPEMRMKMAFQMSDNLRSIVESGVKLRHPDYDQQQINTEVIRLMIGESLFKQISM